MRGMKASEGQIPQIGCASVLTCHDAIDCKSNPLGALRHAAIFAVAVGAKSDLVRQGSVHGGSRSAGRVVKRKAGFGLHQGQHVPDPDVVLKFQPLVHVQAAVIRFLRQFLHARMVRLAKVQPQKKPGGLRGKVVVIGIDHALQIAVSVFATIRPAPCAWAPIIPRLIVNGHHYAGYGNIYNFIDANITPALHFGHPNEFIILLGGKTILQQARVGFYDKGEYP